ncbi:MAG: M48 family metallopeptidase [Burkholderiales bacterium]|nr:M48 family metallopeptidase [Burkholderiales bacterium]
MDFFEQQDQAHRQSRKLLFLFLLAVLAIVLAVNGSLALLWLWTAGSRGAGVHSYPHGFFVVNTAVTLLFIGGGTLVEMYRLRDGGDAVAQMAGGRLVLPSSQDLLERRLLNIVEEMALASGIACPRVYIMDREDAINAFAAGYQQNEAVVAVTHGSLSRLTRDELQGVIGHEFSHILNGDMRLNIKLIGVLFGIQMIAGFGQQLLYWGSRFGGSARSRDDKGPSAQVVLLALGAALFVIGYVGIFFGRLIKSAVSRQREFLADASSVQFTRNPDGIGGALRKIGGLTRENQCGSRIDNPHAEQLSHLFLGAARPNLLSGLFATHPPLQERLRRVYGHSVEMLDAGELIEPAAGLPEGGFGARNYEAAQPAHAVSADPGVSDSAALAFGHHSQSGPQLSPALLQAARDSATAEAVVYALLLDRSQADAYASQRGLLQQFAASQAALAEQLLAPIDRMPRSARLPLLDLCMPALKLLTAKQKADLLALAPKLIAADQHMTQAEFVLQTVLERRLDAHAGRALAIRYGALSALRPEVQLLLSLVAHSQAGAQAQAFARAAAVLPELSFQAGDLRAAASIDFFEVRAALDKLNRLAPLAKPFLILAMLAAASRDGQIGEESADLLRGVCAALDAPVPDAVAATYAGLCF